MVSWSSPEAIKIFFYELYTFLKDTERKVNEIWYEPSEIPFLKKMNKYDLREFLDNFDFISTKQGNYIEYIAIDKVLFVADAIKYLELELRNLSELLDFAGFETLIQEILLRNEYKVVKNFRFSDKSNYKSETSQKRYEIDVIGINRNIILIIDGKQWRRRDSYSSINKAANLQHQRVIALKKNLDVFSNLIYNLLGSSIKIKRHLPFILLPMMVTMEDNGNRMNENQVPLVSISKFNTFLQEFFKYLDFYQTIEINKVSIQTQLF